MGFPVNNGCSCWFVALCTADVLSFVWGCLSGKIWQRINQFQWSYQAEVWDEAAAVGAWTERRIFLLGKGEREGKNKQLQVLWWWQGDVCTHKCILTQLHNTNTSTPLKTCLLLLLPFCLIHVEGRFGITALRERVSTLSIERNLKGWGSTINWGSLPFCSLFLCSLADGTEFQMEEEK